MKNNEKVIHFSEALNMLKDSYKMQKEYYKKLIDSLEYKLNQKEIIINQMKRKLKTITEENNQNKEKILLLLKEIDEYKKKNDNNIIKNKPLLCEKPKIINRNNSCINLHNMNLNSPFKTINVSFSKNKKSKYNLESLKTINYQKILEKINGKFNKNSLNGVKRNLNTIYNYDNLYSFDFLKICKNKMKQKDYNYIIENLNNVNSYSISRNECYNKNNPYYSQNFEDFISSL